MHKIFLSASSQENNIGVDGYGTEEDNMFDLCDIIESMLLKYDNFTVIRNTKAMSLKQEVVWCNNNDCEIAVSNHSNAGSCEAEGTEIWWHKTGQALARSLYLPVSQVSVGTDRGVKRSIELYFNKYVECPSVIIEHFFHTNKSDVADFKKNIKLFADAVVRGICLYLDVNYKLYETSDFIGNDSELLIERDYYKDKFEAIKKLCYDEFNGDENEQE